MLFGEFQKMVDDFATENFGRDVHSLEVRFVTDTESSNLSTISHPNGIFLTFMQEENEPGKPENYTGLCVTVSHFVERPAASDLAPWSLKADPGRSGVG